MATPQMNAKPGQREAEMRVRPCGLKGNVPAEVEALLKDYVERMARIEHTASILMKFAALRYLNKIEEAETYEEKLQLMNEMPQWAKYYDFAIYWSSICDNKGPGYTKRGGPVHDEELRVWSLLEEAYNNDLS